MFWSERSGETSPGDEDSVALSSCTAQVSGQVVNDAGHDFIEGSPFSCEPTGGNGAEPFRHPNYSHLDSADTCAIDTVIVTLALCKRASTSARLPLSTAAASGSRQRNQICQPMGFLRRR